MKILSLKARGFIGFKKGLGLDEIDVNFKGLNGLVALAGPNGKGKSTFIENLSPFRTLASRGGSLKHHVFLRDAFKDLEFEFSGDRYRTLLKIDCDTDRSEGFIWKNGQPQVNGKVTEYGKYLFKLMGSAKLFYSSVFCAQGSQRLSDMTTGELKSLFTEFLRLDRLAAYEKNSKQCLGILGSMIGQSERRAEAIELRLRDMGGTKGIHPLIVKLLNLSQESPCNIIDSLNKSESDSVAHITALRQTIMNIKTKSFELTQSGMQNEDLAREIAGIAENIKLMNNSLVSEKATGARKEGEFDKALGDISQKMVDCDAIMKKRDEIETASTRMVDIYTEISDMIAQRDEKAEQKQIIGDDYLAASKELNELHIKVAEADNNTKSYDLEQIGRELTRESENKEHTLEQFRRDQSMLSSSPEIVKAQAEFDSCKKQELLLGQRDPSCQSKTCSFIVAGIKAQDELPKLANVLGNLKSAAITKSETIGRELEVLKIELEDLAKRINGNIATVSQEKVKAAAFVNSLNMLAAEKRNRLHEIMGRGRLLKMDIEALDLKIKGLREEQKKADQSARQLPELNVAIAKREELTRQQTSINRDKRTWAVAFNDRISRLSVSIEQFEIQAGAVREKIVPDVELKIETQKKDMEFVRTAIESEEDELAMIRTEMSRCKVKLEEKAEAEKDLATVKMELASYQKDLSDWTYLRNACGKNGLQALEIDGVAPMVTTYANDLLSKSFGPNFTVKLITQDPETGREVLDIVVIREDGAETLLENLSGGEKVWILKALRLAMTLVSKERSGRDFQSFFSDEEDGALDGEKALNFVGLYRSLMATGNFDTCFYISHNPDVVAMADHQIRFSREGIQVA